MVSDLAKRIAAEKIFVEITRQAKRDAERGNYRAGRPPKPWWKHSSTIEPLENAIEVILAERLNPIFDAIKNTLTPLVQNCIYCSGTGSLIRDDNTSTSCQKCSGFRACLSRLPDNFTEKVK